MSNRARLWRWLFLLLVAGATSLRPAHAVERAGDAAIAGALEDRTDVARALERDLGALIDAAAHEDRFELYRTSNRLAGAWFQVDLALTLLEQAASAASRSEEEATRITLRDQARFALWDLEEAVAQLERDAPDANGPEHVGLNAAIRALLLDTRAVLERLLAEQCLHVGCD